MKLLIILTLLIIIVIFTVIYKNMINVNFSNYNVQKTYLETKKILGNPTLFSVNYAKWDSKALLKNNLPFDCICIYDEVLENCCPTIHEDIINASLEINIPNTIKLLSIMGTNKSFWYDQEKSVLWVRSSNLGTIISSCLFATEVILSDDDTLFKNYSEGNLLKRYSELFNEIYNEKYNEKYNEIYKYQLSSLYSNLEKLNYTKPDSCNELNCDNNLDYNNIKSIIKTSKLSSYISKQRSSGSVYKHLPENYINTKNKKYVIQQKYLDDTIIDGKNYTLGYPSTFSGCS